MEIKLIFILFMFSLFGCNNTNEILYTNDALPPSEALNTFVLPPGFQIKLFASEPMISDPVDMCIDENGDVYVVEMHGYPLDKSGVGSVKILKDTDGDGFPDASIVFADSLIWPFGIMRWKAGVIVADAPNILYFEDTDGDGIADIRDTLLTGFAFSNPQMNVGGPIYGLDNWIYLSSEAGGTYQIYKDLFGRIGEDIYFPGAIDGDTISAMGSGRTIRFKPDNSKLELTSGVTQFNRTYDQWGRHLLINNSNHIYHEVIAASYLSRNPNLVAANPIRSLSDHGQKVFPITDKPERQLLTAEGVFTSATGVLSYKGAAFPEPYNEGVFMAEPVSNIVHVDRLAEDKSSFVAHRIGDPNKEFLASTDFWFRPVNMYVGPDGALYVLDYYRQIIEHPEWMSEDVVESGDLNNGIDMGRIYRITYGESDTSSRWMGRIDMGKKTSEELVEYLAHPNSWWRENAQRLLMDHQDITIKSKLKDMIGTSADSLGRVHALWTLDGLGLMTEDLIEIGLDDSSAGVRENAIKIAEKHLIKYPSLITSLVSLKDDSSPKVRFQLLCTLGNDTTKISRDARYEILMRDIEDPWVQTAALSAESFEARTILSVLLHEYRQGDRGKRGLIHRLSDMVVTGGEENYLRIILDGALHNIERDKVEGWESIVFDGISTGLRKNRKMVEILANKRNALVDIFLSDKMSSMHTSALEMLEIIGIKGIFQNREQLELQVVSMIEDRSLSGDRRASLVKFVKLSDPPEYYSFFKRRIHPEEEIPVQLAALGAMNEIDGMQTSHYIISIWDNLSPQIRSSAIDLQLSTSEQVQLFLDAIESGEVQKSSVDFYKRVRFMTYPTDEIKMRARSIFSQKTESEINEEYRAALEIKGDPSEGKLVFQENCSLCHQYNGELGEQIGPDLNTVMTWSPEGILSKVLFPNSSITMGYELWEVELNNGENMQGIIANESSSAFTLRNIGVKDREINRSNVREIKSMEYTLMPGGWEEIISVEDMADLISFIRNQ